jgi:hypothetical protein
MRQLRMMVRPDDHWGAKTSSWEQGPRFDLVGTSQTVVVCET